MIICPVCKVAVKNLGRHKRRNRCAAVIQKRQSRND